jgi:hypothetical protein
MGMRPTKGIQSELRSLILGCGLNTNRFVERVICRLRVKFRLLEIVSLKPVESKNCIISNRYGQTMRLVAYKYVCTMSSQCHFHFGRTVEAGTAWCDKERSLSLFWYTLRYVIHEKKKKIERGKEFM